MSLKSNSKAYCKTPIGTAELTANSDGLLSVKITELDFESVGQDISEILAEPINQLQAYFYGDLKQFDLKLNLQGTKFQKKVWQLLQEVPYGKTLTYLELSRQFGDEQAIRAVAHANAVNPLWIVIPCHRIIGSDGSLTGYAGGLWRKEWLLNHEQNTQQTTLF
jgi:methylated-DNA-[protein]-cysteine S-methyltransferase